MKCFPNYNSQIVISYLPPFAVFILHSRKSSISLKTIPKLYFKANYLSCCWVFWSWKYSKHWKLPDRRFKVGPIVINNTNCAFINTPSWISTIATNTCYLVQLIIAVINRNWFMLERREEVTIVANDRLDSANMETRHRQGQNPLCFPRTLARNCCWRSTSQSSPALSSLLSCCELGRQHHEEGRYVCWSVWWGELAPWSAQSRNERRTLHQLLSIMDNARHPLAATH